MNKANENHAASCGSTKLQVLICTYGSDGIERVASASHPKIEGIEYFVSWQTDGDKEIPIGLQRTDFHILRSATKGLSVNRNIALSKATAPLLLISDDDVDYTEEGLRSVIDAFHRHKDMDIVTFRYESSSHTKYYPKGTSDLRAHEK